jgi:hypothetical protein
MAERFDSPDYGRNSCLEEYGPINVAGFIKQYLGELPELVLPKTLLPLFLKASKLENEAEKITLCKSLLLLLPKSHLVLFECIMDLVVKIDEKCTENRMNLDNLAIVLAPCLADLDMTICSTMEDIKRFVRFDMLN